MAGTGNGERDNALRDFPNSGGLILHGLIENARESVLQEADRITDSQRRDKYGPPAVDFAKVQGMAKALWGRGPENEAEHSLYMVFVKLAREQHAPHRDNIVDAIGYLKLYYEIRSEE